MHLLRSPHLQVILAAVFLSVAGNGVLSPILTSLVEPMGRSIESLSLMLTAFTASIVLFTPAVGLLADRYGRRRVLLPTILLFGVGAFIPFIESYGLILFVRVLQGAAVAGMASLAVILIGDLYEGSERSQAMSLRTSAHSLGLAVAPFIAGLLATLNVFFPFYFFALVLPVWIYGMLFLDVDHHRFKNDASNWDYVKKMWAVLKRPQTWAVFYIIFHVCIIFYVALVFVPLLMNAQYGFGSFGQGVVVSYFFLLLRSCRLLRNGF